MATDRPRTRLHARARRLVLAALAASGTTGAYAGETTGFTAEAAYLGEVVHNVDGGLVRGGTYLDRFDLVLDGTLSDAGIRFRLHGMSVNAAQFSERYVGDAMTVSNLDAPQDVRLYEAWLEWSGGTRNRPSLRVGLYDLNSEFDTSELRATFTNSVFGIGHDIAQTGEAGPSIYPNTAFGARGAIALDDRWLLQAVVLDAVPGRDGDPAAMSLGFDDGALAAAEIHRYGTRLTKLALGAWAYTRESEPLPADREPRRNRGVYASADVAVSGDFAQGRGAGAFLRIGTTSGALNEYDLFAATGLAVRRDAGELERSLGVGFALARAGAPYRTALADEAGGAERYEGLIEFTVRAALTPWLLLQPHVQYVRNPSADPRIDDAFVVGLRFELYAALLGGGD